MALQEYADYTNITFTEVSGNNGMIRFGNSDQYWVSSAFALPYTSGSALTLVDILLANEDSYNINPVKGTWGYDTLVHEIGHALGLKHPGNYNAGGGGAEPPYLPSSQDSAQYTIMSYNSLDNPDATAMIFDIAALQYLYGADMSSRTGNDNYIFSTGAAFTIWDANGTDTLDASSWAHSVSLNLAPGTLSYQGLTGTDATLTPCVGIAFNCLIENAIGGSASDLLIGNIGNNLLTGGLGNDRLDGSTGNDTLDGGTGDDVLIGGTGNDTLIYSSGSDQLVGGDGLDTAVFAFARSAASSVSTTTISHTSLGTATLDGVESKAFLETNYSGSFVAGQAYYQDINGDGKLDITFETSSLQFWLTDGTSTGLSASSLAFQHGGNSGFIRDQTQFADINGDGYMDSIFQGLDNRFWANKGSASGFTGAQQVVQHGGAFDPALVQYADVTGDGADDMIYQGLDNRFWLSKSNGTGFDNPILAAVHGGPVNTACVQYGDVNGDGKDDLIYQGVDNRFWISLSTGSSFANPYFANQHGGEFNPSKVQYADISGDGRDDLIYQGDDNRFWVSTSDGTKFNNPVLAASVTHDAFNTDQVHYTDMNGDGQADLMYQGAGNEFWYYQSTGTGFAAGVEVLNMQDTFQEGSAGYGDVNGDGQGDIVFQDANNDFYVAINGADWTMA
jgi:hypothetical protein